ncbi:type VII secretion protein EccE [Nocardia yamanashiensis]|uniref:type VII secretion protein EccE n=1 Tax=Nocardia yamanashiensis TaxID=209247 RepID=UPI00082D33EC|nr:type VII secretion protein EccE [Nocardia yamanashiensis]
MADLGIDRGPVAILLIGGLPPLFLLSAHAPWWAVASAAAVLVLAGTPIRQRSPIRWLSDRCAFRFGRAARLRTLHEEPPLGDVEVAAGICGILCDGDVLVAVIRLAPDLDLPTVIADRTVYTEDTVPVDLLLRMLDQYGITVDIDIVTHGRRTRADLDYSKVYDQLIGSRPVIGQRSTWLVIRLDQRRNLQVLTRRGPCAESGPRALAAAAHRIAARLREREVAAHVLPADALGEMTQWLHAGVEPSELRERWGQLDTAHAGRTVTTFAVDWTRVETPGLEDCWRWHRGWTTIAIALSSTGTRALVRYVGPSPEDPPPAYLRLLSGRQTTAFRATLPGAGSPSALRGKEFGPGLPAARTRELRVAIGPSGQIIGALGGPDRHLLALPLFDPTRHEPRRRTIDVHAELAVAQQLVLRAVVVGAEVVVYSVHPQRWWQLIAAVGDPQALRLATAAEADAAESTAGGIAVFDHLAPRAAAAPTVVALTEPGIGRHRDADLVIDQIDATTVAVAIPMRTVTVELIEPHGETRYFEPAADSERPEYDDSASASAAAANAWDE